MPIDIQKIFEQYDDEFLEFEKIEHKLSSRPDIHAFILLNNIEPDTSNIIGGAEHDVIYLATSMEELSEKASTEQIIELIRCGVMYDDNFDCLAMFV